MKLKQKIKNFFHIGYFFYFILFLIKLVEIFYIRDKFSYPILLDWVIITQFRMDTNNDYIKKVNQQILDSYNLIQNLKDQTGDLELIKKELLKINGFFNVLIKKIGTEEFESRDLLELKSKVKNYVDNYYFVQEIDTMSSLYSSDRDRIKNMRLKILEGFQDKRLIDSMQEIMEKL